MKCPRCGLAELNDGHCIVCGATVEPSRIRHLRLKFWRLSFAPSTRKLWNMNLYFYFHAKIVMFAIALMTIGAVIAFLLETVNPVLTAFMIYFFAMATYEFYKQYMKKHKEVTE